jgi:hypothetical protein
MKNRTIAIITLLALVGLCAAGCNSGKNAANNAAQTAATAAGAMGNAANNAAQGVATAAAAAGGAAQNAMGNAANAMTKPNCGAVQPVWVNLKTKVYHEPGDPRYGNTKHGEYLCPSQATAQGFRPAGGATHGRRKKATM